MSERYTQWSKYSIGMQNDAVELNLPTQTDVHDTSLSRKKTKLHGVGIVLAASNRASNSK